MAGLLFYGHSVLAKFPFAQIGNVKIDNRAVSGSIAEEGYDMLIKNNNLSEEYDTILLMYGINELWQGLGIENPTYWIEKNIEYFNQHYPESQLILSLVMRNLREDPSVSNVLIDRLNNKLSQFDKKYSLTYWDWQGFYDANNYCRPELTIEGVHLTQAGYQLLAEGIDKIIRRGAKQ